MSRLDPPRLRPPLVARGPVTRLFHRLGILRGDQWDVARESLAWMAFTWLPLLAAALPALVGRPIPPFLAEPGIHVRLVIALPLCVLARKVSGIRCETALRSLESLGPAAERHRAHLHRVIALFVRACRSSAVETLLLIMAVGGSMVAPIQDHEGMAGHWFDFVSLSAFRFVFMLALFRWLAWFAFLLVVSRIELDLRPAHPDGAGGLGLVQAPGVALALLGAAGTSIVAADSVQRLTGPSSLATVLPELLALVGVVLALTFAPLLPFAPQMVRARLRGLAIYGRLAVRYVHRFEDKHLDPTSRDPELLGSSDIQSLADLGNSVDRVRGMRSVPFERRAVMLVVLITVIPAGALVLAVTPLTTIIDHLARIVLGLPRSGSLLE
jgi:hypothetical protein